MRLQQQQDEQGSTDQLGIGHSLGEDELTHGEAIVCTADKHDPLAHCNKLIH